jgi:hypothetical protein
MKGTEGMESREGVQVSMQRISVWVWRQEGMENTQVCIRTGRCGHRRMKGCGVQKHKHLCQPVSIRYGGREGRESMERVKACRLVCHVPTCGMDVWHRGMEEMEDERVCIPLVCVGIEGMKRWRCASA